MAKVMRLFGSYDGLTFFEMKPGIQKRKGHMFLASFDNGDTFSPLHFSENHERISIVGNAKLGNVVEWATVAPPV